MGTCCFVYNSDIENQDLIMRHAKGESTQCLNNRNDGREKLKSLFHQKANLSNKETNENDLYQESIQLSEFSYMKETASRFYNELSEKDKERIVNEFIAPIETANGNSGFINNEDFDLNLYICKTIPKEEKKDKKSKAKKSNSLKRFSKKTHFNIKDKDSGYNSCGSNKRMYKRSRIKLLTE